MYNEIDGWRTIPHDICLKSAKKQGQGLIEDYQHLELVTAMSYCAKLRVAIDVGAHVGLTAFQMAKTFEKIHAFEINPEIYDCMVHNLKSRTNNVITYPVGLGEKEELVNIKTTNKSFGTHIEPSSIGTGNITVKSLDSFNIKNVDFIKIDAEGYEPFVAKGGLETIKKSKPVILYERKDHPQRYGYSRDSIREILMPYGYRLVRKLGRGEKNAVLAYRPGIRPDDV